ncbi:MAG TPA: hypothetical protein VGD80_37655 [Kofleriaceae bacterium]
MSYVPAPNGCFVEPRLTIQHPIKLGETPVVLIAAPGAVGKSTLAAELASRTGAAMWDLSKMNVGTKTFAGTVLEGWDTEAHGVLKRIGTGEWLFVLDALDEAQVRAGSQNFDAFLSDVAELCREPRPRPTIVLLARSDTADLVELMLDDAKVKLARYQVEYFDEEQAQSFIDKRLDARRNDDHKQSLHRQQRTVFTEARTALFKLVYTLFDADPDNAWTDVHIRDFLGYAPVLEALTDYLDAPNYRTLIQELEDEKSAAKDPWRFLTDIISRLQEREQGKIQEAVRPLLGASGWSGWARLYTPDEQCSRVLRHTLRMPVSSPEIGMSGQLVALYEEALRTILPQHPFLAGRVFANVVFKEFSYAWGITRGDESTQAALRNAMRERESPFLPSPLFSRFVVNSAPNGKAVVDGQDFGIVYESLLARSTEVQTTLLEVKDSIEARVVLGDDPSRALEFDLLDTGAGVHFWRRLNSVDIDVARAVRLGLPEQRFTLGPAVDMTCNEFSILSDDLDVDVTGNVSLRAAVYNSSANVRIRIRDASRGRLAIAWPDVAHPWASYRTPPGLAPAVLAQTPRGDALRKLVLMFRRQRSRKEETVRNARWSPEQSPDRDQLLKLALEDGVLRRTSFGSLELESDFDSLKTLVEDTPQLSPNCRAFVVKYLGKELTDRLLAPR